MVGMLKRNSVGAVDQKGISSSGVVSRSTCDDNEWRGGWGAGGIAGIGNIGAPVSSASAISRSSAITYGSTAGETLPCASHACRSSVRFIR